MASMEDQGDFDDGHSFDSDENPDQPAEEMASAIHDRENFCRRATPEFQTIRDVRTKYVVKNPSDVVGTQAIIEDEISSNPRVVELSNQLAKTEETCLTHNEKHETEIARLNDLAS